MIRYIWTISRSWTDEIVAREGLQGPTIRSLRRLLGMPTAVFVARAQARQKERS